MCNMCQMLTAFAKQHTACKPSSHKARPYQLLGQSDFHIALANVGFVFSQDQLHLDGHAEQDKRLPSAPLPPSHNDDVQGLRLLNPQ